MILTPRLVELRLQAREAYPDARWLPGDECPVGERVLRDGGGEVVVVGANVTKKEDDRFEFWWMVTDRRFPGVVMLEWPPTLRPLL